MLKSFLISAKSIAISPLKIWRLSLPEPSARSPEKVIEVSLIGSIVTSCMCAVRVDRSNSASSRVPPSSKVPVLTTPRRS